MFNELQIHVDQCNYLLDNNFDKKTKEEHKVLSEQELTINRNLSDFIVLADQGDKLFKSYRDISYLIRPPHLISKPIIAVLIMLGKLPKVKPNMNY